MKFVADECVPLQIVQRLRDDGHEVSYVLDDDPGISDEKILERAVSSSVPVLTEDKDFGDLVFERGRGATGVVLLRLRSLSSQLKARITADVVTEHADVLASSFVVVSPGRVRVRKYLPPGENAAP